MTLLENTESQFAPRSKWTPVFIRLKLMVQHLWRAKFDYYWVFGRGFIVDEIISIAAEKVSS